MQNDCVHTHAIYIHRLNIYFITTQSSRFAYSTNTLILTAPLILTTQNRNAGCPVLYGLTSPTYFNHMTDIFEAKKQTSPLKKSIGLTGFREAIPIMRITESYIQISSSSINGRHHMHSISAHGKFSRNEEKA